MNRRQAISAFGASFMTSILCLPADVRDYELEIPLTKTELKDLIYKFDLDYPSSTDSVYRLPEHIHKMNKLIKALADEVLRG